MTATDTGGNVLVWGQSIPVQLGALDGTTLSIFVQRTGAFAAMPSPLTDARAQPLLAAVGERDGVVAGGSEATLAAQTEIYDFLTWSPLDSPPALAIAPKSLAAAGLVLLAINDTGAAWLDLTGTTTPTATAPAGGSFADVSGGATYVAADGTGYVVGATRTTGAPSKTVLRVSPTGDLAFLTLS